MKKIVLPENHLRSISSSMYLIESLVDEMKSILKSSHDKTMSGYIEDMSAREKKQIEEVIASLKTKLAMLAEKYNLTKQELVQSRYIASRKSKMWEILGNSQPKRLKGFGEFPPEYQEEFEYDLDVLTRLVEKL